MRHSGGQPGTMIAANDVDLADGNCDVLVLVAGRGAAWLG